MAKKDSPYPSTIQSCHRISIILSLVILTVSSDDQLQSTLALPLRSPVENYLQVPSQGLPFKIALFADLHFGEDAWTNWGPQQDLNSVKVMSTVLDNEQPGEIYITTNFLSF